MSANHWTHHDPAVRELIRAAQAEAWDARDRARPVYLGPDDGHYNDDCGGWSDCHCGVYINPYREAAR